MEDLRPLLGVEYALSVPELETFAVMTDEEETPALDKNP